MAQIWQDYGAAVGAEDRISVFTPTASGAGGGAKVIFAGIKNVRRDRLFGRIEAEIILAFRLTPSSPTRVERLYTNVPARVRSGRALRDRLVDDALSLAMLMEYTAPSFKETLLGRAA